MVGRDIGSFVAEAQAKIKKQVDLPPRLHACLGWSVPVAAGGPQTPVFSGPLTLLIVCLLLFASFGSFKNALLILLNIPLALVGGLLALWLSGENLSVTASVGFISLFGIALENGMVLVTYLNQLLSQGLTMDRASIQGATLRLRPVLMTAATTALGLIPLLLSSGTDSEVQRPLAVIVIGGLVTSTVLTLLVLPAAYKWFATQR